MSGEMIERAAKGMFECRPAYTDSSGKRRWTWEMADEYSKAYWRDLARAAIEALRWPTEAMVRAGIGASPIEDDAYYHDLSDSDAERVWQAMIDAARSNPSY